MKTNDEQLPLALQGRKSAGEVLEAIRGASRTEREKGAWFDRLFRALADGALEVDSSHRRNGGRSFGAIDLFAFACAWSVARAVERWREGPVWRHLERSLPVCHGVPVPTADRTKVYQADVLGLETALGWMREVAGAGQDGADGAPWRPERAACRSPRAAADAEPTGARLIEAATLPAWTSASSASSARSSGPASRWSS